MQQRKGCWSDLCLKMPGLGAGPQDPSVFVLSFMRVSLETEHSAKSCGWHRFTVITVSDRRG